MRRKRGGMTEDEALSLLRYWREKLAMHTTAPTDVFSLKKAARMTAERGYHPFLSLACLEAGSRAIFIKGDRDAYNEREGRVLLDRWYEKLMERSSNAPSAQSPAPPA